MLDGLAGPVSGVPLPLGRLDPPALLGKRGRLLLGPLAQCPHLQGQRLIALRQRDELVPQPAQLLQHRCQRHEGQRRLIMAVD